MKNKVTPAKCTNKTFILLDEPAKDGPSLYNDVRKVLLQVLLSRVGFHKEKGANS